MALPTIVAPEHEIKLVSIPKPVTFRPYLVKEEKLLLMAQAGEDQKEIEKAVKQIIRNCTNGAVNVDKLPPFDLEYLFLQLRAKSVNNVIESQFECQNLVQIVRGVRDGEVSADGVISDKQRCGTLVPIVINIDDIKLVVPEGHTNRVMLTEEIGVIMKYPATGVVTETNADLVAILADSIESVFNKDGEVWEVAAEEPKAVAEFVENLSVGQVDKLRPFFETMPKLSYTFTFKCPKCKYEEEVTLSGLMDFFD